MVEAASAVGGGHRTGPTRRETPWNTTAFAAVLAAAALMGHVPSAGADDPDNCLFCHQYRGLSRFDEQADRLHLYFVKPEYVHDRLGPHARVACTDCHRREEVGVIPHKPVTPTDCTRTCHLEDPRGLSRRFTHAHIPDMLAASAHPPELLREIETQHGRLLAEGQATCLYCHDEPVFRDPAGVIPRLRLMGSQTYDRCDVCHDPQIPVDLEYYVRHVAARLEPARPPIEIAQVCAICHSDPVVQEKYGLTNTVASFARSFHGKAALLGAGDTADCLSCHVAERANAHLMLSAQDPASSVHPTKLADTCRSVACHPGADVTIAEAAVHLDLHESVGTIEYLLAAFFIVFTVLTFGPSMVMCVLELFHMVISRGEHHDHKLEALARRTWEHPEGRRLLTRFTVSQRVQHWVLAILFIVLALTGFPMKFADQDWARATVNAFGGLGQARFIHHWAGLALVAGLALHLVYVLFTLVERLRRPKPDGSKPGFVETLTNLPMWAGPEEGLRMMQYLAWLMKLRKEKPTFGRFSVKEKFEYLGVFWGTVLLGITGGLLWGEQIASHFITGRVFNLALIAHTYEAFLAVIHVGILHIVNVMLSPAVFPLSPATITGKTPIAELAEAHEDFVREAARKAGVEGGPSHA